MAGSNFRSQVQLGNELKGRPNGSPPRLWLGGELEGRARGFLSEVLRPSPKRNFRKKDFELISESICPICAGNFILYGVV